MSLAQINMKNYIQLSDSIIIEYEELSIKNTQELIRTLHGELILDLSTDKRKAYLLENGKVLVVYDKQAFLYNSQADIVKLLNGPKSRSILNGLNPYNERFPEKVSTLINNLLLFLDISFDSIKLNDYFLRMVDTQIVHLIDSEEKKASEIMSYTLHFIALAGEVYKSTYGGHWQMVQADDGTWQPYIIHDNQEVDLFVWIYDSINENEKYPSIYSGYQAKTVKLFKH